MMNYSSDLLNNAGRSYGSDRRILPGQLHLSSWPVISTLDNIKDHFVIWKEINHPFIVVANHLMIVGYPHNIKNVPDQHYYRVSNELRDHPIFQEDPAYLEFIEKQVNSKLALDRIELLLYMTIQKLVHSLPDHVVDHMRNVHTDDHVWDEATRIEEKRSILYKKLEDKAIKIFKEVINDITTNEL